MTWAEWAESGYNLNNFLIQNNGVVDNEMYQPVGWDEGAYQYHYVQSTDTIINGKNYETIW